MSYLYGFWRFANAYYMKYTKEIMKVDNYSGRDDEELNKVIKEIDDLEEKE